MKIFLKYSYYEIHYIEVPNDTVFFLIGSKVYIFLILYYRLCFNTLSPYLVNCEESTVLTLGNLGFPMWHSGKELTCQCRRCKRCELDPWVRNILWVGNRNPLQYFLSGKFHGQMNLTGYSPWGCKDSDMTEHTYTHTHKFTFSLI